jgi:hypothetical protein
MDRSIVLSILGAAVLGFVGMLLLMPDPIEDEIVRLPWLIEQDAGGRTQVFGFTLGKTTLAEVRRVFREDGEINLFRTTGPSGTLAAEVYFEQIHLERLRADFVLTLDADQATLAVHVRARTAHQPDRQRQSEGQARPERCRASGRAAHPRHRLSAQGAARRGTDRAAFRHPEPAAHRVRDRHRPLALSRARTRHRARSQWARGHAVCESSRFRQPSSNRS